MGDLLSVLSDIYSITRGKIIERLTRADKIVPPDEVMDYEALTCFRGYEVYEALRLFAFASRVEDLYPGTDFVTQNEHFVRRMLEIWVSPFADRLFKLFSYDGENMTFTDFIDLMAAFHFRCPKLKKAEVVFRMFDFDEDGLIGDEDVTELLKRLTDNALEDEQYKITARIVIEYGDQDGDGFLNIIEFKRILEKDIDFPDMFHLYFLKPRDLRAL